MMTRKLTIGKAKWEMKYGKRLRKHRKERAVSLDELAAELSACAEAVGLRFCSRAAIARRETGEVPVTGAEFAEAIAAIERIVEKRGRATDPLSALEVG